jgi:hypothetical protein
MESIGNPYTPGSGLAPAELAGREDICSAARVAIERIKRGVPAKGLLIVGLRGVGKSVLLNRIRKDAETTGTCSVFLEAVSERSLPSLLAPELRLMLLRLDRKGRRKEPSIRAQRALAGFATALKSSYPDLEVGLDCESQSGLADSGVLQQDLLGLLESAAAAAQHAQSALVLFIDDMHFLPSAERAALIIALHRCAQRGLPVALVSAGLPQLRGQMADIESLAERLFEFVELGPLSIEAATLALTKPAAELGVQFEQAAVTNVLAATQCHPYFLQELAKQAWDFSAESPITLQDTRAAAHLALAALDEKFFRLRFDRLTPAERKYIRAMAELGPGPHRSGDIAAVLKRPVTAVGPARSQLIAKGVIWSPGHGDTAFAVPRFDEYLRRTWPDSSWRN